jgi:hypothetical protein
MKIFKIISLITFSVLIATQIVKPQTFEWVKGMNGNVAGTSISTDTFGNSFITGYFTGTALFGTTILTSESRDIFIAKYDNAGNCLWVKKAGGSLGQGISTDAEGNCYTTGFFSGTTTFGTTTLTVYGGVDIFIAKYDNAGNFLWAKQAGGVDTDHSYGISADANGNIYLTGSFSGTATFGTTTLTSYGSSDIFIAKYDNAGNCLWVKKAGGTSTGEGWGISTDVDGNCYATGLFSGTAIFGTTTLTSYGEADIFITKYDNAGNCLWVKKAGGVSIDHGYGIFADINKNIYLTGHFQGTATFDTNTLTSYGEADIFIAKYDYAGNCLWVRKAGGVSTEYGNEISADALGNSYSTGFFSGTAIFGTTTLTSYGNWDIFIAKFDNSGNFLWVKQAGGVNNDLGYGISALANGDVYVTGTVEGSADFGSTNIVGLAGFLAKIVSPPLPVELTSFSISISKNNSVTLEWNTSTEKNNKGFDIEKSIRDYDPQHAEGINNWKKIGFVAGNGSSTEQRNYSFIDDLATSGKYFYRLKQIDYDGNYAYSKELEVDLGMPIKFSLEQNYPNPFNPSTVVRYALPFECNVKLVVYNLIGEVVKELVNKTVSTGYQEISFDAGKLSNGIYFYTLNANSIDGKQNYQSVKKMLLLK